MSWYEKIKKSIRFWILRNLPACRETTAMISESMERRLTLREHLLVTVHLWACSWCQWYREHLNLLREALRKEAAEASELELSSTPGLSDEARARLKGKLANRS